MQVNMHACSKSIFHWIWVWTNMFPVSARPAFIIFVNSDALAFAWRWFGIDTRSCLHDVACRLLQCSPRCGSEDNNKQATTSVKCSARVVSDTKKFDKELSRLMHQELHWLDIPELLLAGSADTPVSARQGASVPIKLLHSSQSIRYTAASMLRCTSSADCTSTSSQHLAGVCCRWSDDVQRYASLPDDLRDPALSTSTFGQSLKTHLFSAYQHVMHYINVQYLLTYLLSFSLLSVWSARTLSFALYFLFIYDYFLKYCSKINSVAVMTLLMMSFLHCC